MNQLIRDIKPRTAEEYVQRAKRYEQLRQYDQALADYETAVEIERDNPRTQLAHAGLLEPHLSAETAISTLSRLIEEHPTSSTYHRFRGVVLRDISRYEEALRDLNKAVELLSKDGDLETYLSRGMLFVKMKQYEKALADFDKALELKPTRSHWYKRRALAHFHLENYEFAIADLAKRVEERPEDGSTLWWVPPADVAACPDKTFRDGMFKLADKAVNEADTSYVRLARAGLLEAFGRH